MSNPNPLPFEEWLPDKSDRQNPAAEAKGVYSIAGQYAPFPDIQQYGPSATDDDFTVSLLHFDGADATTSFPDDGQSHAHTWTPSGNAQIDTAQFKFGGASGLFDGVGDFLTTADDTDFQFGTADFTIEFWVRFSAIGTSQMIYDGRPNATEGLYPTILFSSTTQTMHYFTNSADRIIGLTTIVGNTWYHVAVARASGVTKMFVNGVQDGGNYVDTNNYTNGASRPCIGASGNNTANQNLNGWIDELRVSKGIARYTAGYVTNNDAFTKVLLHFGGADATTFFGDSALGTTSAHTWTAAGNAQIDTADSKFGGSSGLFDGAGDWVVSTDHADFTLGAGNWTIDFWFKCNAAGGTNQWLCGQQDNAFTATTRSFEIHRSTANVIVAVATVGSTSTTCTGATQFTSTINVGWHHLAFVRNGNTCRLFIDGLQEGGDQSITGTVNDSSNEFRIGAAGENGGTPWTGWIDEFRLSVGIDRFSSLYTGNLPDSFTKVLVHANGADTATDLPDHGGGVPHPFTVAGNAQIDTAASKFGGASALFDGAGDWWRTPDLADLELGSGDFTIDFWFNCVAAASTFKVALGKTNTASAGTNAERSYVCYRNNTTNAMRGNIFAGASSHAINGSFQVDSGFNTGWHHYALVRSGNNLWQFIDGSQDGQNLVLPSPTVNDLTGPLGIASFGDEVANPWQGWLDEIRLSVGVARWSALAVNGNDSFTKLLIHFNGPDASPSLVSDEFGSTMVNSKVFTVAGNAQLDTADSKFGGSSGLFDGTGDFWTTADSNDFTLGTSDMCAEVWFKVVNAGVMIRAAGQNDSALGQASRTFLIQRITSNQMQGTLSDSSQNTQINSSTRFTDVTNPGWHHFALIRRSNVMRIFLDGVPEGGPRSFTTSINNSPNNMGIGCGGESTVGTWNGWLDEFRLSIGNARYGDVYEINGNDQYTKILLHFEGPDTDTIIPDDQVGGAGSAHAWAAGGAGQLDTAQFKFGSSSLLCGGAGDYVNVADNADFTVGTSDFTVDCWVRPQNTGVTKHIAGHMDAAATTSNMAWHFYVDINDLFVAEVAYNGSNSIVLQGTLPVSMDAWHHFALVRSGTDVFMFRDGALDATGTLPAGASVNNSTGTVAVGRAGGFVSSTFIGWIDEFRFSVGIARWLGAFTVPTGAYGGAVFTPPTAAFGGPSFTPPIAAYAAGFSASLPASAYGPLSASFTLATVAFDFGGGAENIVLGADTFYDSATAPHIFFGDIHRLYTLQSRHAADVSKAGGYSVGATDTWQFAQFGDNVVAVTASSAPQHYVMGTSVDFANLAGAPPTGATSVARVSDFMWMGKLYTVYWSAFNNVTDWAPSSVTQAGSQQLDQERGEIMCLIGLDYAAIFQERGIRRAIYVGSPVIFDFGQDYVEKARGCIARNAAVAFGRLIFYAADDGFYVFDGQSSTPIGHGKVDEYFTRNLNYAWRHKISCGVDYSRKIVVWAFPTGSAQLPTELLIFSMQDARWTHDVINLEFLFDTPAEPATVDNFNLLFPADNLDGTINPNDIDSAAFDDRRIRLGGFQIDTHLLGLFTGPARAATLDTKEFEPMPGRRGLITEVWPLGDYPQGAVSTSIGYRLALPGAAVAFTNPSNMNRVGYCPQRKDGRFLRIRQNITAGAAWRRAEGVHATATPTGGR
jgi:Concanavalin A-like lectin/glucanases superfamily